MQKKETYTVESYNSRVRHYLARFKRKTKCYSKSVEMIEISLNRLIKKLVVFQKVCCYKYLKNKSLRQK